MTHLLIDSQPSPKKMPASTFRAERYWDRYISRGKLSGVGCEQSGQQLFVTFLARA